MPRRDTYEEKFENYIHKQIQISITERTQFFGCNGPAAAVTYPHSNNETKAWRKK